MDTHNFFKKGDKVIELECVECEFKDLRKANEGDYLGKIMEDLCPICGEELRISGVYEGTSIEFSALNELKGVIEKKIVIDEIKVYGDSIFFKVSASRYDKSFLPYFLQEFRRYGCVPLIRKNKERGKVNIIASPRKMEELKKRNPLINIALFLLTVITTTWAGYNWADGDLFQGFLFSVSLLSILGIHELGHMVAARKHGIDYSFPYFIPAPPIGLSIGTFGAVISSRSPIHTKNDLFDLGASGPLAGFIVTIVVMIIGLSMSEVVSPTTDIERFPFYPPPLMLLLVAGIFGSSTFSGLMAGDLMISLHPIVIAGWIGAIVTMLNLLPAGFLDGGHISRSVMSTKTQKIVSYLIAFVTIILGWVIMGFLMLLISMGGHPGPLDDVSKLSNGRKASFAVLLIVLLLCVTLPLPMT